MLLALPYYKETSTLNKLLNAFTKVIWDSDLTASRLTLALAEILWAILLLWPGNTFDRGYYHNMANLAPEDIWGAIFLISSVVQFYIANSGRIHTSFARYFAAWNAGLWVLVISCLASVFPLSASLSGEIALMIIAVWICLRPYIIAEGLRYVRNK